MIRPLLISSLLFVSATSTAGTWSDLWHTPDQQGSRALQKGDAKQAANLFDNPQWKGTAYYRAKNYSQALQEFQKQHSAKGYYNQGNALAQMGQYKQALAAYQNALQLNPTMADAKYNINVVKKLKQQKKKQDKQQKQDQKKQNQQQQGQPPKDQAQQNKQPSNKNDEQNQPKNNAQKKQQNGKKPDQKNKPQDKQQNDSKNQPQPKQQPQNKPQNKPQQQPQPQNGAPKPSQNKPQSQLQKRLTEQQRQQQRATKQWLDQIPDDPGGLLRQKFLRDHQQIQKQSR